MGLLSDYLEHIPTNRQSRVDHITGLILSLKPDAIEAEEIVEAIQVALQRRYEGDEGEAVHYLHQACKALQRLDADEQISMDDEDDGYSLWRARQE
jgi:hypothetical protein